MHTSFHWPKVTLPVSSWGIKHRQDLKEGVCWDVVGYLSIQVTTNLAVGCIFHLPSAQGVNGRSMMRWQGGVLSKVGSHFDNNTRKRNKISTVHNSTLWASKSFSDLRFSISCPMTPQSLSEVYAIVELSWWKFPLSFLIGTSYPQQSQYTYKNVCIVPGGHAGMTHVAAVVGDMYCGYQVPEYTTYSEVSCNLYAEVTNNISTYLFF